MDDLELSELVHSLSSGDPALSDEEISKWAERKRDILVLVLRFLADYGYTNSYQALSNESFMQLGEVDVADNVDLMMIVQEFVDFYFSRFGRYPKLVRQLYSGYHQALPHVPPYASTSGHFACNPNHWNNSVHAPTASHAPMQQQHQQVQQQQEQQQRQQYSSKPHYGCQPDGQHSAPVFTAQVKVQLPVGGPLQGHQELNQFGHMQQPQALQMPLVQEQLLQGPQQVHTPPQHVQPAQAATLVPAVQHTELPPTVLHHMQQAGAPAAVSAPAQQPQAVLARHSSLPALVSLPMPAAAVQSMQVSLPRHASLPAQVSQPMQWSQPELGSLPMMQHAMQGTASAPLPIQAPQPLMAPMHLQPTVSMQQMSLPVQVCQPMQVLSMPMQATAGTSQPVQQMQPGAQPVQQPYPVGTGALQQQLPAAPAPAASPQLAFAQPTQVQAPAAMSQAMLMQPMQPVAAALQTMQASAGVLQAVPVQPTVSQPHAAQPSASQPAHLAQPAAQSSQAAQPICKTSAQQPVLPQTPALTQPQPASAQASTQAPAQASTQASAHATVGVAQPQQVQQAVPMPSALELAQASAALAPAMVPLQLPLPLLGQQMPGQVDLALQLPLGLSLPVLRQLSACSRAVEVVGCTVRLSTGKQVSQLGLVSELSLAPMPVPPSQLFSFRTPDTRISNKRCSRLDLSRVQEDVLYALVGCLDVGWNMTNITKDTKSFLEKKYGISKASVQLFMKNRAQRDRPSKRAKLSISDKQAAVKEQPGSD